jgi:hypothetical protein
MRIRLLGWFFTDTAAKERSGLPVKISLNNPDKCREYSKRWREKNPELSVQRTIESRSKKIDQYREKERDRRREYRAENLAEARAQSSANESARRAAISGAKSSAHCKSIEKQLRLIALRLTECLGVSFHLDHITPISRGGIHHHLNMRVIPARLNQIKYKRTDSECPPAIKTALKHWTL